MITFKNVLIDCINCNKKLIVKQSDYNSGSITCSHLGCGHENILEKHKVYDKSVIKISSNFGKLIAAKSDAEIGYSLIFGKNIIGTNNEAQIKLIREKFTKNGKCYISRFHCTIEVIFDEKKGKFEYTIFDGGIIDGEISFSKNGTFINSERLKPNEKLYIKKGDLISLGPYDVFRLETYNIPQIMLDTYLVDSEFDPDKTQ